MTAQPEDTNERAIQAETKCAIYERALRDIVAVLGPDVLTDDFAGLQIEALDALETAQIALRQA